MIGPHHLIMSSFTAAGQGAAAWIAISSDDRSRRLRASSGSFSMRENIVGTSWLWVTPHFSTSSSIAFRVEALHDDDGAAHLDCEIDRGLWRRMVERRG